MQLGFFPDQVDVENMFIRNCLCRRVWIRIARDLNDRGCYKFILQL